MRLRTLQWDCRVVCCVMSSVTAVLCAAYLCRFGIVLLCDSLMSSTTDRLVGLVEKASTSGAEDLEFEYCLRRDFSGSSHTSDLKIGTPVATLPGTWHYRLSPGTGRPGVSIV